MKFRRYETHRAARVCLCLSVLVLSVLLGCTACGGDGGADVTVGETVTSPTPDTSGGDAETVTMPETEPITLSEMPTEVPTEPMTQPETQPEVLFTPTDPTVVLEVPLTALNPIYRESHTTRDGVTRLSNAGTTMTWTSEFYGHDSAIDRDLGYYGWKYEVIRCRKYKDIGEFFLGSFDGGHYCQLVTYTDGKLIIRSLNVSNLPTYEYNGQTVTSVYAGSSCSFSVSEYLTAEVGLDVVLRGVGFFNEDDFTDLVLVGKDGTLYLALGSENGFTLSARGHFSGSAEELFCGDVDGDRRTDLLRICGQTFQPLYNDGTTFVPGATVTSPLAMAYARVLVGDVNKDGRADIMMISEDGALARSLFGRGDGFFGPHEDEVENANLYGDAALTPGVCTRYALGDGTGDGVPDLLYARDDALYLGKASCDPPYDYSIFGMILPDGSYRIYAGGRWMDQSSAVKDSLLGENSSKGDGDHVMVYDSADGVHWTRHIEGPTFYSGYEQGIDEWWSGNTLEPEVILVDGVYHMFLQSSNITESGYYGDYINYACSTDGYCFERKTDRPVILPDPAHDYTQFKEVYGYEIGFNHEEVIYVADDPDGKCFWMYTGHFINDQFQGYVRLRSADPTTFYWSEREATHGISQIGNQIAYINNFDGNGNRLFLRITFCDYTDADGSRTVPTFQYSKDGIHFFGSDVALACVDVTDPVTENNRNAYFLGLCTKNGTGELEKNYLWQVEIFYLVTTANQPAGFPIFWSEGGVGKVILDFS